MSTVARLKLAESACHTTWVLIPVIVALAGTSGAPKPRPEYVTLTVFGVGLAAVAGACVAYVAFVTPVPLAWLIVPLFAVTVVTLRVLVVPDEGKGWTVA